MRRAAVAQGEQEALDAATEDITLELPWIERLDIVADQKITVPDENDDLQRELQLCVSCFDPEYHC